MGFDLLKNSLSGRILRKNKKLAGVLDPLGIFGRHKKPVATPTEPITDAAMRDTILSGRLMR